MDAAAGMNPTSMNPAKRHHPDPAAAAAMAAMHEHQMAAMFAANAAGGMAAMHALPGLASGMSGPGGPGPHLKDEKVEVRRVKKHCTKVLAQHDTIVLPGENLSKCHLIVPEYVAIDILQVDIHDKTVKCM